MAHLRFVRLPAAGALALLLALSGACGVPDYSVPAVPDAGGIQPDSTGGGSATGTGGTAGGTSSSDTGGTSGGGNSSLGTGGQPPQDALNCTTDANCSSFA